MAGLIHGVEVETVRRGLERVQAEIEQAAQKAGRSPDEVELLAASAISARTRSSPRRTVSTSTPVIRPATRPPPAGP